MWNTGGVSGGWPRAGTGFDTGRSYYRYGYKQEICGRPRARMLRRDPSLANTIGEHERGSPHWTISATGSSVRSCRRRSQLAMSEDVRERSDGKLREPPMEVCRHEGQIDAVHRDGRTNLTGTIRLDGSEHGRKEAQDRARNVPGCRRALR